MQDLNNYSSATAITYMNRNSGYKTMFSPMPRPDAVAPPPKRVGLFASRAHHRPNPIALSALQIQSVNITEVGDFNFNTHISADDAID